MRIYFEDHGQDFLFWDINEEGQIVDCQPFQYSIWSKWKVSNTDIKPGDTVEVSKDGETMKLKYPVEKYFNPQVKQ